MTTIYKTSDRGLFSKILRSYACVVLGTLCVCGFALQVSGVRDRYHDCKTDVSVLSDVCDGRFRFVWWSVYFELIVIVSICLASTIGLHLQIKHSALAFICVSTTQLILGVDRFVGEQISPGEKTAAVGFALSVLGNFLLILVVGAPNESILSTSEGQTQKQLVDSEKKFVSVEESEKKEQTLDQENHPPQEELSTVQSGDLLSEREAVQDEEETILEEKDQIAEKVELLSKPETLQAELDAERLEMETLKVEQEILKSDQMDLIYGQAETIQEEETLQFDQTVRNEEQENLTNVQTGLISIKEDPESEQENRSTEQESSGLEQREALKVEERDNIPEVKNVVFERQEEETRIRSAAASTSYGMNTDEIQVAHSDDSS